MSIENIIHKKLHTDLAPSFTAAMRLLADELDAAGVSNPPSPHVTFHEHRDERFGDFWSAEAEWKERP